MTPANLEKHVAKADPVVPSKGQSPSYSSGSLEFSQRPARFNHAPITEAEIEAIEVNNNNINKQICHLTLPREFLLIYVMIFFKY